MKYVQAFYDKYGLPDGDPDEEEADEEDGPEY